MLSRKLNALVRPTIQRTVIAPETTGESNGQNSVTRTPDATRIAARPTWTPSRSFQPRPTRSSARPMAMIDRGQAEDQGQLAAPLPGPAGVDRPAPRAASRDPARGPGPRAPRIRTTVSQIATPPPSGRRGPVRLPPPGLVDQAEPRGDHPGQPRRAGR